MKTRFRIRGHGERNHVCNCPYCTHKEKQWVEINEVVEAATPTEAEHVILKREGDVLGDFRWIEGPKIAEVKE